MTEIQSFVIYLFCLHGLLILANPISSLMTMIILCSFRHSLTSQKSIDLYAVTNIFMDFLIQIYYFEF